MLARVIQQPTVLLLVVSVLISPKDLVRIKQVPPIQSLQLVEHYINTELAFRKP